MLSRVAPILSMFAGAAALAGCTFGPELGEGTTGELEKVEFSYTECVLGCPLGEAFLLGTTEAITIRPRERVPAVRVESDSPSVFVVEQLAPPQDKLVVLRTVAPGEGNLRVVTDDGTLLDYTPIRVAAAAALALRVRPLGEDAAPSDWQSPESLSLSPGELVGVGFVATDEGGRSLRATLGVQMATTNPAVANLEFAVENPQIQELLAAQIVGVVVAEDVGRASILARLTQSPGGPQAELPVLVAPGAVVGQR